MIQNFIQVPLLSLQELANQMEGLADEGQDVFDRILNSLQSMQVEGSFVGAAANAAMTITEANKAAFADAIGDLYSLSAFLKRYTSEIETADIELSRAIQSI